MVSKNQLTRVGKLGWNKTEPMWSPTFPFKPQLTVGAQNRGTFDPSRATTTWVWPDMTKQHFRVFTFTRKFFSIIISSWEFVTSPKNPFPAYGTALLWGQNKSKVVKRFEKGKALKFKIVLLFGGRCFPSKKRRKKSDSLQAISRKWFSAGFCLFLQP